MRLDSGTIGRTVVAVLTIAASLAGPMFCGGAAKADQTFIVTTNAASGAGSLASAIASSNTAGGNNTITFNLSSGNAAINAGALPIITSNVVIDGANAGNGGQVTINGNGNRPFFLGDGGTTTPASPFAVTLQNMSITGSTAQGGSGGAGGLGGGGGGGLGGAVFVSADAALKIANVSLTSNTASGGGGGGGAAAAMPAAAEWAATAAMQQPASTVAAAALVWGPMAVEPPPLSMVPPAV